MDFQFNLYEWTECQLNFHRIYRLKKKNQQRDFVDHLCSVYLFKSRREIQQKDSEDQLCSAYISGTRRKIKQRNSVDHLCSVYLSQSRRKIYFLDNLSSVHSFFSRRGLYIFQWHQKRFIYPDWSRPDWSFIPNSILILFYRVYGPHLPPLFRQQVS